VHPTPPNTTQRLPTCPLLARRLPRPLAVRLMDFVRSMGGEGLGATGHSYGGFTRNFFLFLKTLY
jgi:hypothetical protein